jgi:anti-sigma factor RsiW
MRRDRIENTPPVAISEIDLLAYADGLLDDPRRLEAVLAFLDANPAEAERIDAYIEQNREMRRLYDPVFHEPLPEHLLAILERGGDHHPARHWLRTAAGAAALLAAAAAGWLLGQERVEAPVATVIEQSAAPTAPAARPLRVAPEPAVAAPSEAIGAGRLMR